MFFYSEFDIRLSGKSSGGGLAKTRKIGKFMDIFYPKPLVFIDFHWFLIKFGILNDHELLTSLIFQPDTPESSFFIDTRLEHPNSVFCHSEFHIKLSGKSSVHGPEQETTKFTKIHRFSMKTNGIQWKSHILVTLHVLDHGFLTNLILHPDTSESWFFHRNMLRTTQFRLAGSNIYRAICYHFPIMGI